MKRSELKQLIREAVEEVMQEFAPLGVAEKQQLHEKSPPDFPKALHDKLLKQYKGEEEKAYATMWKIFYAKKNGNKRVDEMWTAWENKSVNEAEEGGSEEQNAEHDETDLSNPEENREVELANKIKALADELLGMHGVKDEAGEQTDGNEENSEENK